MLVRAGRSTESPYDSVVGEDEDTDGGGMLERDYSCSSTSVQVAGETTGNQKSKKGKKPLKRLIKMLRSEVVLDQQSAAASWYILVVTPVLTSTLMLYHTPVRFLCPPRLPLSSLLLSLSLSLSRRTLTSCGPF